MNPSRASELDLNAAVATEPAQLYGQLGMQIFNSGNLGTYFKATSDNFVIVSGGPSLTITQDNTNALSGNLVSLDATGAVDAPMRLLPLTVIHDQDDWVDTDVGIKLSFKPNTGLYFIPHRSGISAPLHTAPDKVDVIVGSNASVEVDVEYEDRVRTATSAVQAGEDTIARSVIIKVPPGANYDADVPVQISRGLLVTYDPVYKTGTTGWPLRQYIGKHQGTNGYLYQTIANNLLLINKDQFNIDAVLHPSATSTILANLVRADNFLETPKSFACRSMRDRFGTTFDHVTANGGGSYQISAISLDAIRVVFENEFDRGDLFVHFPSKTNTRAGVGTFDNTVTSLHFSGSAGNNFTAVGITYGTAGRYVRIRRESFATILQGDDLVISGLKYFPSGEDHIGRIVVGYPDENGISRLTAVTDSRVIGHQQINMFLDRPLLLNPLDAVSADTLIPFPDIYVSYDGRNVIQGSIGQDSSGDLRFALPGAGSNLKWSSDFSRVVYTITTRDRVSALPQQLGDFNYSSDGTFSTNNTTLTWSAGVGAATVVNSFVDTTIIPGNNGGLGIGIRATDLNKIVAIDVNSTWPTGTTLRISGLMVSGLEKTNTAESHISNNFPTYATLTSGAQTAVLSVPGGQFFDATNDTGNILFGHLGLGYQNNSLSQTFAQEPVYVSGTTFTGVTQSFAYGTGVPTFATIEDNLNELVIVPHEPTNFEIDNPVNTEMAGIARGVTFDGFRLTFPHPSPLRFLTADTIAVVNGVSLEVRYENIERFGNDYGGLARTAYIRALVHNSVISPVLSTDIFGWHSGATSIAAGTQLQVRGLTVANVVPGTTGYTGNATARPKDTWDNVDFGRSDRVPGLALSLSSAGAVDAYLHEGITAVVINTGSSGANTGSSTSADPTTEDTENPSGSLFNACLLNQSRRPLTTRR